MSNPVAQKKQLPAYLVLTIICLVAALVLAATNAITKGPINEHKMAAQRAAFGAVMPADAYETLSEDGAPVTLVEARDASGNVIGYCVVASEAGYQSQVSLTMGVGPDGVVTGAQIGASGETAGFGTRWDVKTDASKGDAFKGMNVNEGGAIEALSGATVTSTAVLNAANKAFDVVNAQLGNGDAPDLVFGVAEKKPVEQMTLVGDIHEGAARGFQSDVKVQLTLDESGAVSGLAIESSNETSGFGTRCMEDAAFAQQFVGKTAPFTVGENIDALAGATVTSKAVAEAVNAAVAAPANPDAVPFGSEEETVEASATVFTAGDYEGSAKGFQSDVKVNFTVDENSVITALTMDTSNETPGFGTRCAEDENYVNQFIGLTVPVTADALSGATVTSNAVVEAINSAAPAGAAAEVPAGTPHEATAKGFQSDVKVTVYVDEAGVITGVVVDSASETPGFGTRCAEDADFLAQFVGQTAPVTVDVLSGATVTSNAIIEAVNAAVPAAPVADVPAGNVVEGTAEGFQSDVKVTVTLDENNTIAAIVVDSASETPGFGTRCAEDADFLAQFVGQTAPVTVDALAGATVTSNAIIEAVNAAVPAAPVAEVPAGNVVEGTAKGFQSDVKVTVTLDENNTIAAIVVDSAAETSGFGTRCAEDADFLAQFVGQTAPVTVDVLAGATVTSNAIIDAVNSVFPTQNMSLNPVDAAPLTATVAAWGGQDITVTLTLNADGAIATLVVDADTQSPGLGKKCGEERFAAQFIGQTGPFVLGENVDAVSYATVTSQSVVDAVNSLIP